MKKRIIISLLCGLVICCIAAYSFGTTGIVNTDTLRLRKSNSTDSSIITLLSIDDKVEILERTENGWYKVKYTDAKTQEMYEGYVSADYITIKEESETIPTTNKSEENKTSEEENNEEVPQEEVGTNEETVKNTSKVINKGEKVYIIPLINSNTTKILENDVNVEVIAELSGWSYVTSDSFEGWVRTDKLREVDSKNKVGYINANSVNFREQADTSGEIISTLSRNNEVEIIEENNGWTKIKYKGNVGYIATKYISDSKIETTSRSAASRRIKNTSASTTNTETTETTDTQVTSNATASEVVAYAKNYLGYRYVHGGNTPSGFDCSGFTQYVYKHFGYSLSRSSSSQAGDGVAVSKSNLQQGDIVCFSGSSGSKKISHVGIYVGGGKFIHSANTRKGVIISSIDGDGYFYVCARRIIN